MLVSCPTRWSQFAVQTSSLHAWLHLWWAHRQGLAGPIGCALMEHFQGSRFFRGCAKHVVHVPGHGSSGHSIAGIGAAGTGSVELREGE